MYVNRQAQANHSQRFTAPVFHVTYRDEVGLKLIDGRRKILKDENIDFLCEQHIVRLPVDWDSRCSCYLRQREEVGSGELVWRIE